MGVNAILRDTNDFAKAGDNEDINSLNAITGGIKIANNPLSISGFYTVWTAGENFVYGQPAYMGTDNRMHVADRTDPTKSPATHVCADPTIGESSSGRFLAFGTIFFEDGEFDAGVLVYLGTSELTQIKPFEKIQPLGVAVNEFLIIFNPLFFMTGTAATKTASTDADDYFATMVSIPGGVPTTRPSNYPVFFDFFGTIGDVGSNNDTISAYVTQKQGFSFYTEVKAATAENLVSTYSNGTAGNGRTLTNASSLEPFSADGADVPEGSRVLVTAQSLSYQNGIYVLTTAGDESTPWLLTGATDSDSSGEIVKNKCVYNNCVSGNTLNEKIFRVSSASSPVIGTDAITYAVLSLFDVFAMLGDNTTLTSLSGVTGNINNNAALSTTLTTSGTSFSAVAGESLAFGNVCYRKSDGKMWKADANAAGLFPAQYMAIATISTDATGLFIKTGFARNDSWTWTVGGLLYLSTTAGNMTQTQPSATDDCIQVLGEALTATIIDFSPSRTYITHV